MSHSNTSDIGNTSVALRADTVDSDNQEEELLGDYEQDTISTLTAKERKRKRFQKKFPGYRFCDPVDRPIAKDDRHRFRAPLKFQVPHRHDIVFTRAAQLVEDINESLTPLMAHFDPLRIEALNAAPVVLEPYACESTAVVHCLLRKFIFVKVQLRLSRDPFGDWDTSTVMLKDGDRWMPLRRYLVTAADLKPCVPRGFSAFQAQFSWWKSTGKTFEILKLPQEIQDYIWLHALGERMAPRRHLGSKTGRNLSLTLGTPRDQRKDLTAHGEFDMVVPRTSLSVLYLNKAVYQRVKKILHDDTTKFFNGISPLMKVKPQLEFSSFGSSIRKMELALSPIELVDVFQVEAAPFNNDTTFKTWTSFEQIRRLLPNLKDLCIIFKQRVQEDGNPWAFFASRRQWAIEFSSIQHEYEPCHARLADWVMAFAVPFLRGLRTVKLEGAIKTCMKKKWEGILNGPVGSGKEEIDRVQEEARNTPDHELPPRCACPLTCGEYLLDVDDAMSDELDDTKSDWGNWPPIARRASQSGPE